MSSKSPKSYMPKPSKPKRPSGQYAGKRESMGKINGGDRGEPQHPQSHEAFEKLGC